MHLFQSAAAYPLPAPGKLEFQETELEDVRCLVCRGELLYLLRRGNGGTFEIYDTSDGKSELLSSYSGLGTVRQLRVEHNIALITARQFGAYFFNVSDPRNLRLLCHYDTAELATAAVLSGKFAFIGCRVFGVEILDISAPDTPRHLSTIRAGEVQSAFVDGTYLYTGTWGERQVNIFDVSDPELPKKAATIPLTGRGDGLFVQDGVLYIAMGQHRGEKKRSLEDEGYGWGNGFAIYDVSDPSNPELLSEVMFPFRYYYWDWDNWDIVRSGNYVIVSHTLNGLFVYDVRDLRHPVLMCHSVMPSDLPQENTVNYRSDWKDICLPFDPEQQSFAPITCAAVADGKIFLGLAKQRMRTAESDEFFHAPERLYEASLKADFYDRDPGKRTDGVQIRRTAGQAHEAAVLNGLVYTACGDYGVAVFEPEGLTMVSHACLPGCAYSIREHGGLLYVSCGTEGLAVCVPEADTLRVLGRWKREGSTVVQAVPSENGRHLILHVDGNRVVFLDVTDPCAPRLEDEERRGPGLIYCRQITHTGAAGQLYGVYWNGNGIRLFDLGGESVMRQGEIPGKYSCVLGVTGTPDGGMLLVNKSGLALLHQPDAVPEQVFVSEKKFLGKPQLFGDRLLVCDRLMGDVFLFDASDLHHPRLLRQWNFSGHPDLGCRLGSKVFIPLGHQGIAKLDIS